MGGIGIWQILLVVVVVLLLFGAGRVPRLMGDMAKGIKSFKQGMKEEVNLDDDKEDGKEPSRLQASERSASKVDEKDRAANS